MPCRHMWPVMKAAGEQVRAPEHLWTANPIPNGSPRVLRNLELDGPFCLTLDDPNTFADPLSGNEISDLQSNKVTPAQLAVDRKIEKRQISEIVREFKSGADGPDLFREQRAFLADKGPLFHGMRFSVIAGS